MENSLYETLNDEAPGTESRLLLLNMWNRTSKRQMQIKPATSTSSTALSWTLHTPLIFYICSKPYMRRWESAWGPQRVTACLCVCGPSAWARDPRHTLANTDLMSAHWSSVFATHERMFVSGNAHKSQTRGADCISINVCARLFCIWTHRDCSACRTQDANAPVRH